MQACRSEHLSHFRPFVKVFAVVLEVLYQGVFVLGFQAVEEKASALLRISAAEDTATQAFEEVGNMRDEIADLRDRLAKVTMPLQQGV